MFYHSKFDQDISQWDVSQVKAMWSMFEKAQFNQDINAWQVNPKCNMKDMFNKSKIEELPTWYKK